MSVEERLKRLERKLKGEPLFVIQEDGRVVEVSGKASNLAIFHLIEGSMGVRDEDEIPYFDVFLNAKDGQRAPIPIMKGMAWGTRRFPENIVPGRGRELDVEKLKAGREEYRARHPEEFPQRD